MRFTPALLVLCVTSPLFADEPPRVLDDRLQLELFAEHPTLVTPTGIDVDHQGRIFVIESNTHFPPEGYQGHPSDRLWMLADTDGDHRADQHTLFTDGLKHAMSVAVRPLWLDFPSGGRQSPEATSKETNDSPKTSRDQSGGLRPPLSVFVATRREILLLRDTDGDSKADERTQLVHLETKGDYPHNGLAGFAFDALGNMFFGFGENLGADYQIIGSDGVTLKGGGEGGNIYRCRPDGSKLERWATGFWNPHASCFDAFGRMFTVDNDPDSRPPCRLLHIVPGGDYGYRFRNGRKGTHPFTAWNGELPGTLPMVAGTGEAPSGIVCYEADGFPDDYLGTLLVGSWGDHRIDQFVLEPKGASFTSVAKPIVQGDENFRPVGLALAPDGSLFFSDWVLKDYKLHGKGRVWRLSGKKSNQPSLSSISIPSEREDLISLVDERSLTKRRLAAQQLVRLANVEEGDDPPPAKSQRGKFEQLMAAVVIHGIRAADITVRFYRKAELDIVDAAVIQLFDPIYGIDTYVADETDIPVKWSDMFHPDSPMSFSESLLFPLACRETGLLFTAASTTCKSGREAYAEAIPNYLNAPDPFVFSALVEGISRESDLAFRSAELHWNPTADFSVMTEGMRLATVLAARRRSPSRQSILSLALNDSSPRVLRAAVQWIGEENLQGYRSRVNDLLHSSRITPEVMLACLATLTLLDGVPASEFEKTPPTQYALAMVKDDKRPAALRATALRMIPASSPELPSDLLVRMAQSTDAGLQLEAVRTLQQSSRPEAISVLLKIVANPQASVELRCEALGGLCATPHELPLPADVEQLLLTLANPRLPIRGTNDEILQLEAIRALRGRATEGTKIARTLSEVRESASEKRDLLEAIDLALGKTLSVPQPLALDPQPADSIDSGRRVFFHHQGPLCSKCHQVQGRGGNVGPDLSTIARTMSREKLWQSIVEPSKEISPQYVTWVVLTTDGKVHQGIVVTENGAGDLDLGDAQGRITKIPRKEIEERAPSKVSTMPEGLTKQFTSQEARDLLAYLMSFK